MRPRALNGRTVCLSGPFFCVSLEFVTHCAVVLAFRLSLQMSVYFSV